VAGRERVLRLRIHNRDDAPLALGAVSVFVPVERVAFDAAPGHRYLLRYGDPALPPPHYDLARTAGDPALFAARAAEASLGPPQEVPAVGAAGPPWTERHPALLWGGLLVVVAAMAGLTWRALRTAA
jgi:hypothetical protein